MAMTVRLPEELDKKLEELAAREHTSKHALLIQGAEAVLERRGRRAVIDDAVDFVLAHDADLLKRLEDA